MLHCYCREKQRGDKSQRKELTTRMKNAEYSEDLPRRLYTYFASFENQAGAPSFSKFAKSAGITLEELESYRKHTEFERAWRECNEIRRDYLIDTALTKRADASLVKFLLAYEFGMGEETVKDSELSITLEVLDGRDSNEAKSDGDA